MRISGRILLIPGLVLAHCAPASAQLFPDFGTISPAEIKMTSCEFDPEAEAVILLKEAHSDYDQENRLITSYHIRIKIFSTKALDQADIRIPYYASDNYEEVSGIEGMTINYDSTGFRSDSPLDPGQIFDKQVDKRWSVKTFSFPSVKPGSILEYRYTSLMRNWYNLEDWKFQDYLPVQRSDYFLSIAPNLQFAYQVYKSPNLHFSIRQDRSKGSIEFEMDHVPGLRNEPYMDARNDYLQRVIFQLSGTAMRSRYMTSWKEVARELMAEPEFGGQLNRRISGTEEFLAEVNKNTSARERMEDVYNYVQSQMSWNGYQGVYSIEGVKAAWTKKTGSTADINLLLVNMLRDAGLEADPVLVSERKHGKVNTNYPFVDQFSGVYACVSIDGHHYYLDGRDKGLPPDFIPVDILHTTVFRVNKKGGELIEIEEPARAYETTVVLQGDVSTEGTLSGQTRVISSGYAGVEKTGQLLGQGKGSYTESMYRKRPGTEISEFQYETGKEGADTLKEQFHFTLPAAESGDYVLLPINLFTGFESNPFLSPNRFSDVNFGYRQKIRLIASYRIPANFRVDALPKSLRLVNPEKSISMLRMVSADETSGIISYKIEISIDKNSFPANQYSELREFYRQMFGFLDEQIVLKKK